MHWAKDPGAAFQVFKQLGLNVSSLGLVLALAPVPMELWASMVTGLDVSLILHDWE